MKQIWNDALSKIEGVLSPQAYSSWIKPIKFIDLSGSSFILEVPSEFHRNEVKTRYISLIRDVVAGLTNKDFDVDLQVATFHEPGEYFGVEIHPLLGRDISRPD